MMMMMMTRGGYYLQKKNISTMILPKLILLLLTATSFVVGDGPDLRFNCVVSTTEGIAVQAVKPLTLDNESDRCYVTRSWSTIEQDFRDWIDEDQFNCGSNGDGYISFNFQDNPNESITFTANHDDTPTTIICAADGYDPDPFGASTNTACVNFSYNFAIRYLVRDTQSPDVKYHDPDSCCGNDCSCDCPDDVIEVETDATNCFYSAGRNEYFGTLVATDNCGVQGGYLPGFIHYDSNYQKAVATDITLNTFLYAEVTHSQAYVFYDDYEYWENWSIEDALDDGLDGVLGDSADLNNNYPGCVVTFRAVDKTPPQITCPETQYLVVDPDPEALSCVTTTAISIPGPVAVWDNCADGLWPDISGFDNVDPTTTFPIGKTTLTYIATDEAGNAESCEFDVIVEDKTPPIAICPASAAGDNDQCAERTIGIGIALANDVGLCGRTVDYFNDLDGDGPHFEENCDIDDDVCETFSIVSGTFFPVSGLEGGPQGPIPITYTATDRSGNTGSCTFEVEVFDTEDPVIETCPKGEVLENEPGLCSAPFEYCTPVAHDNCPGELTVTSTAETTVDVIGVCPDLVDEVIENGTRLPVGTTTVVTHTVTDQFGNTDSCEQVVSVVDTEDPKFSPDDNFGGCPGDIRLPATHDCGRYVWYGEPYAIDNCQDGKMQPTIDNEDHLPGRMFYYGETEVLWIATDASGNTGECSFIIEIYDDEELDPSNINCGTEDGIIPMGSTGSFETNYNGDTLKENGCPTESVITCATCQVCSYEGVAYDVSGSDCEVDIGSNVVEISQAGDIGNFISYPVQVTDLDGRTVTATCTVCVDSPTGVNRRKLLAEEESKKGERRNRGRSRPRGGGGGGGRSSSRQNETAEEGEEEEIFRKLGKGSSYDRCDIPVLDSTEYLGTLSQCEYDGGKGKGSSKGKGKGGKGNFDWSCPKRWDPLNNDFKCQSAC